MANKSTLLVPSTIYNIGEPLHFRRKRALASSLAFEGPWIHLIFVMYILLIYVWFHYVPRSKCIIAITRNRTKYWFIMLQMLTSKTRSIVKFLFQLFLSSAMSSVYSEHQIIGLFTPMLCFSQIFTCVSPFPLVRMAQPIWYEMKFILTSRIIFQWIFYSSSPI